MKKDEKILRTFRISRKLWETFDTWCKKNAIEVKGGRHTPSKSEVINNMILILCETAGLIKKEDVLNTQLLEEIVDG